MYNCFQSQKKANSTQTNKKYWSETLIRNSQRYHKKRKIKFRHMKRHGYTMQ